MDSIAQGSPEWFAMRCGKVTASRISDVCAKIKTGEAASRRSYRAQLVAERLTGRVADGFKSSAMQWGLDHEPDARRLYSFMRDIDVLEVGSIEHPTIKMASASPDGLCGEDGLVEIKCPSTETHIETMANQKIDRKYIYQMQWQMACTGRKWCDFVSYDPTMPPNMQLYVCRVYRDDKIISDVEAEVVEFLEEVDETVKKLIEIYGSNHG